MREVHTNVNALVMIFMGGMTVGMLITLARILWIDSRKG